MVSAIKENVERIRGEIAEAARRASRGADEVRLMGVTKFHPLEMMLEAAPLLDLVGENRVQEAAEKRAAWPEGTPCCPWHLIGHLQRNKIRRALENFDLVESIDALETACSMDRVLREGGAVFSGSLAELEACDNAYLRQFLRREADARDLAAQDGGSDPRVRRAIAAWLDA